MKRSGFIFERADLLEYRLHKISLNRGSSYIISPQWLKIKGATIYPENTMDNECFNYAIIAALHHQEIGRNPQRISKLKPFIDYYNWKDIEFPSHFKIGENLNKIIRQLLLISYMCRAILSK